MSRFLLAVWSLETHVHPNLAVAAALRDHGHEVAFYAAPKAAAEIEQHGFPVFPFRALQEERASAQFATLLEAQGDARKLAQTFSDVLLSQLVPQIEDLAAVIDRWHPGVLITDMAMVGPFAVLQEWKQIPVAVLSHVGYCMVPGPQGPVPGRAMMPRTSFGSRLQAAAIHWAADWMTRGVPQALDRIRQQYGLAPTGLRVTQLHARASLLLIPTIPELDYSRTDLPATVRYVGPCLWPPRSFVRERNGKPLIVVEEGGYYRQDPFLLKRARQALSGVEWEVQLIPGKDRVVSELGPLAAPMRIANDSVEASLVITTGNTESVLRALSRGTPLVVVPSMLDQAEMALRVKVYGAGVMLPERECTPERLNFVVREILSNGSYKQRAAEAAALLARCSGPHQAVRELEKIAV